MTTPPIQLINLELLLCLDVHAPEWDLLRVRCQLQLPERAMYHRLLERTAPQVHLHYPLSEVRWLHHLFHNAHSQSLNMHPLRAVGQLRNCRLRNGLSWVFRLDLFAMRLMSINVNTFELYCLSTLLSIATFYIRDISIFSLISIT